MDNVSLRQRILQYKEFMGEFYDETVARKLLQLGFFVSPASLKHSCYEGGLFDHSLKMAEILLKLTEDNHLQWKADRSPKFVGMYHGLWKMNAYLPNEDGGYRWNPDQERGQGKVSAAICNKNGIFLTEEETICIEYYAGAFTAMDNWPKYVEALHKCSNVAWTAHADVLATHIERI